MFVIYKKENRVIYREIFFFRICENAKPSQEVLREQIAKYRHVFQIAVDKATAIDRALARWLERQPEAVPDNVDIARPDPVMKCPKCRNTMSLRTSQRGVKFIGCSGFPECNNAIWLRLDGIEGIEVLQQTCQRVRFLFNSILYKQQKRSSFLIF